MKAHRPRKRFGQNFLQDPGVVERILQAAAPAPDQAWVEIGPGRGALTFPLLERTGTLTAIELDRDLIAPLQTRAERFGQLRLIQADALQVDYCRLDPQQRPLHVIGNLPYNISTPLIFHLLRHRSCLAGMLFMLQKEVVDRLTAEPGSKHWGRLSVMVQLQCQNRWLFDVPPQAFHPPPKVMSAIVGLQPLPRPLAEGLLLQAVEQIATAAFNQRRKTLRNSLGRHLTEAQIEAAGLSPASRPEQVPLEGFVQLARQLPAGRPA